MGIPEPIPLWNQIPEVKAFVSSHPLKTVDEGELLVERNQKPTLGFLVDGLVKVATPFTDWLASELPEKGPLKDYDEAIHFVVGPERWFGFDALQRQGQLYNYQALCDCRYILVEPDDFFNQADSSVIKAAFHDCTLTMTSGYYHRFIDRRPLRHRVLSCLWNLRRQTMAHEIPMTQKDLAMLVGVHKVKLGGVLKELENEGLLETQYKGFYLADWEKVLIAFAEEFKK